MSDTKEKILITALRLFSSDGFEAVSVSDIAGELGITKGALYKHYKNKREIFESIVKRMCESDSERSQNYSVPKEDFDKSPAGYDSVSIESIKGFTVAQYIYWTEDEFASYFRRMLTLEQYRSPEMAELYGKCITSGPVAYLEDIFRGMTERGILKKADPHLLATEYYAPLFLLINMAESQSKSDALNTLNDFINKFFDQNKI